MGRSKKEHQDWESAYMNNRTFNDYYNRLMQLAINVFEWKNLPPSVDERFIELSLYSKGYVLYFNDLVMGNLCLTCTIGGQFDVYRIPMNRRAYAVNGYQKECDNTDSVIVFNNYLHLPTMPSIELFARRLYELERSIDTNVKAQKTPVMVLCPEEQRLSMKNLYMQYDGNEPYIFGDKALMELNEIKVLKTDAPYVVDKLELQKHAIWNEALTYIGIENSNQDKKERLVADEVNGNSGMIEAHRYNMLNSRRQAVAKINAMFGTNIEVGFRSNLDTLVNSATKDESYQESDEEGEE